MNCIVCNGERLEPLFEGTRESTEWILNKVHYGYIRCAHCSFVQCRPIPSEADLTAFYRDVYAYEWFDRNAFFKRIQARHRAFKVRNLLQPGIRCLDFGCGHGFFVRALLAQGRDAFGFDIGVEKIESKENSRITYAQQFGDYSAYNFDLITAWHVLEHMRDPDVTLNQLAARLKQGGKLFIAVPNLDSSGFRRFGVKWGWTQQPYVHINHFTHSNLTLLLQNHGFDVVSVKTSDTWDQNVYDMLISYFFYGSKSRNPVRSFKKNWKGELLFRLNQVFRLLFTPVSYGLGYFRSPLRGSELRVVAVKR